MNFKNKYRFNGDRGKLLVNSNIVIFIFCLSLEKVER